MKAVRYFSRSGNTKAVAQAMAQAIGAKAISTDAPEAPLEEKADILFIGGALYAYGLDENLSAYLEALDAEKVGKAVVFSTSWISKHAGDLIKQALEKKGIEVADSFYARVRVGAKISEKQLKAAKAFAKNI